MKTATTMKTTTTKTTTTKTTTTTSSTPWTAPDLAQHPLPVQGSSYSKDLRTKEISQLLRTAFAALVRAGIVLPLGLKVSVRSDSFSGGSAIRISVTACPVAFLNPARVLKEHADPHEYLDNRQGEWPRYTPEGQAILDRLTREAKAYLEDRSDIQSDYFCVNFYDGDAKFDWELEASARKAIIAAQPILMGSPV